MTDNQPVIFPPPLPGFAAPLLSEEQLQQLASARLTARKIRRAVSVATFDGWTIAIFAALSLVCGFSSVRGVGMGAGMAVIAGIELTGAGRLRRLDPRAARMLGFNQLAFAMLLIVYAIVSLHGELTSGLSSQLSGIDPAAVDMLKPYEGLVRQITIAVYGSLIAVAVLAQGGTALFYFSRTKHVEAYLKQTPAWIVQMQRAGISL